MWADCIRVTHPYATLGLILLPSLPFGLHVLGLPLAFILSQDQTLHSIFFNQFLQILRSSKISYGSKLSASRHSTLALFHFVLGFIFPLLMLSISRHQASFKNRLQYKPLSIYIGARYQFHSFNERLSSDHSKTVLSITFSKASKLNQLNPTELASFSQNGLQR